MISPTASRHPRSLFILSSTEMWERFSYYGMRSLLILYMVNHLFVRPDANQRVLGLEALRSTLEHLFGPLAIAPLASQVYGLYTALVFLTPLAGGLLASRFGRDRMIIAGGVLMAIGHFLMASESLFLVALLFLILGVGAFKPNITSQVGSLYEPNDARLDSAFTIFYMGLNLGAFLAPLVCGSLGQGLGWHYGFAAAGAGMLVALAIYTIGRRHVKRTSQARATQPRDEPVEPPGVVTGKIVGLGILCVLNTLFWATYEQQGNSIQLWADRFTLWPRVFGVTIPSTFYQAMNPIMIFGFAPVLSAWWVRNASRGQSQSAVRKMAIGCALVGIAYCVMVAAAHGIEPSARRSLVWLVAYTLPLTIGELYLSPSGLALVSNVAPVRLVGILMGMWFLQNFMGNWLAGYLGSYFTRMPMDRFFGGMAAISFTACILMLILERPLRRLLYPAASSGVVERRAPDAAV